MGVAVLRVADREGVVLVVEVEQHQRVPVVREFRGRRREARRVAGSVGNPHAVDDDRGRDRTVGGLGPARDPWSEDDVLPRPLEQRAAERLGSLLDAVDKEAGRRAVPAERDVIEPAVGRGRRALDLRGPRVRADARLEEPAGRLDPEGRSIQSPDAGVVRAIAAPRAGDDGVVAGLRRGFEEELDGKGVEAVEIHGGHVAQAQEMRRGQLIGAAGAGDQRGVRRNPRVRRRRIRHEQGAIDELPMGRDGRAEVAAADELRLALLDPQGPADPVRATRQQDPWLRGRDPIVGHRQLGVEDGLQGRFVVGDSVALDVVGWARGDEDARGRRLVAPPCRGVVGRKSRRRRSGCEDAHARCAGERDGPEPGDRNP